MKLFIRFTSAKISLKNRGHFYWQKKKIAISCVTCSLTDFWVPPTGNQNVPQNIHNATMICALAFKIATKRVRVLCGLRHIIRASSGIEGHFDFLLGNPEVAYSSVIYISLRHIIKKQHWYVFHNFQIKRYLLAREGGGTHIDKK